MKTLDLKTEYRSLYTASPKKVAFVKVPPLKYLMIDGSGDPNGSEEFQQAVQALYNVSYTIKFTIKKKNEINYPVMALEGLWWMEGQPFNVKKKELWKWRLMIMQPNMVTKKYVTDAVKSIRTKKELPSLALLRFEKFSEGLSVQTLHIGSYVEELPTITRLHAFAAEQGYEIHGYHHEIYQSDPRRVPPEKYKTILRHPVRKSGKRKEN